MFIKRFLIVASTLIMIISLSLSGFADIDKTRIEKSSMDIQPLFTNITYFYNDFNISSMGNADANAFISAHDVDSVEISISLQQYINGYWLEIKKWNDTSQGTSMGLDGSYYVSSGYIYRTVSTGYVYKNGKLVESTTDISNLISY